LEIATNLGIDDLRYQATVRIAAAAPAAHIMAAGMAIHAGICNYGLIVVGWYGYSGSIRVRQVMADNPLVFSGGPTARDFYYPHGMNVPPQWFSFMCRYHMNMYGTTREQLGAVAVAFRKHAQLNPHAVMHGRPMTMEDYLGCRMISDPYCLFDCSLECDGAGAIVVTTVERARDLKQKPVYLMGFGQGQPYPADDLSNRADFLEMGVTKAAPRAFEMAGITHKDIDFAQIYDAFSFQVIEQIEEMGFCKRGEGGPFVEGGRIELGGQLPVNTSGGLMSEGHVLGMNHIVEAVRQLRGDAGDHQVEDAEIGMATGYGDFMDGSVVILRR
jgi:acetyl-CoA acetyltransferase